MTQRQGQGDLKRRIVTLVETENTQPRTVPLSTAAADLLMQAHNISTRPAGTGLVFFGEPGWAGSVALHFQRDLVKIKKENDPVDLHFYDLRHEAVSRSVETASPIRKSPP